MLPALDAHVHGTPVVTPFDVQPGERVILHCRVSTDDQRPHLAGQERLLRQLVADRGGRVLLAVHRVGPGSDLALLRPALAIARLCNTNILAETLDRLIRPTTFHPYLAPHAPLTRDDLRRLAQVAKGVRLMTIVHPDASPSSAHGFQTKRGQLASGNPGGRPRRHDNEPGHRRRRRDRLLEDVLRLRQAGLSSRDIAERIRHETGEELSHRTVQLWISQGGNFLRQGDAPAPGASPCGPFPLCQNGTPLPGEGNL